jgi:hypothetical protein
MGSDNSKPDHRLLATSVTTRIDVPRERLCAAGAPSAITVAAIMENETRDETMRLQDQLLRTFDVELLLTKHLTLPDVFSADFTKEGGASLIKLASGIRVDTASGAFYVDLNSRNEMALIRMKVEARVPIEARNKVYDSIAIFLDHLSYAAGVPILTGQMKIYDYKNHIITIDMVGPEREAIISTGAQSLPLPLAPVYALYREFKNSSSAYYRLLCLYKIMEGLLGPLRKKGREEAEALGVPLSMPKEKVPDHPDISRDLRHLVGKPIKDFYDNVLQKPYRDAASHFLVGDDAILQVSAAEDRHKFAEMTFICDLCVRVLSQITKGCCGAWMRPAGRRSSSSLESRT